MAEPCPGCGGVSLASIVTGVPGAEVGGQFAFQRCHDCGWAFLSPWPGPAAPTVWHEAPGARSYRRSFQWLEQWWFLLRARRLVACRARGRLLDVGCGSGGWLAYLNRRGWRVEGVEPYPGDFGPAPAEPGVWVFTGPLSEARYPDASFDVVTLWHVIEHLSDAEAVLHDIARILKREGLLVVATPNAASWEARLFGRRWFYWHPPQHRVLYTPETLSRLLQRTGFRVMTVSFHDPEYNLAGWTQSLSHALGAEPYGLRNLFKASPPPATQAGGLHRWYSWLVAAFVLGVGWPFAVVWAVVTAACRRSGCFVMVARRVEDFG